MPRRTGSPSIALSGALLLAFCSAAGAQADAPAPASAPADPSAAAALFDQALAAHERRDWPAYRNLLQQTITRLPDPSRLLYRLAAARVLAGDKKGALAALDLQIDAGIDRDPGSDPEFAALAADPAFAALRQRMSALRAPLVASTIAFTLPERDLLTEGIAHDPATGDFFVASVHRRKIVRRKSDGTISDLFSSGANGAAAILGLAFDPERRLLWAISAGLPQAQGLPEPERKRSALLALDPIDGALKRRIDSPPGEHLWNDLELAPDGSVYVSDVSTLSVLKITPDGKISTVVEGHGLRSPGGLAFSQDGMTLYVADWAYGLAAVDVASGNLSWLAPPPGATVLGVDGLRRDGNALIGIQNGVAPARITRFDLAPDGRSIVSAKLLERAVPGWDEPTLGTIVGRDLYYVSNSHWPRFADDGTAPPAADLDKPAIRRLPLGGAADRN
jgi:sugar lactone lactonase YvrE